MNITKKSTMDKLYMWLLVLMPVLAQYQAGPLDLDVVLMIAVLVVSLLTTRYVRITPINKNITYITIYIVVVTFVNLIVGRKYSLPSEIILRAGRYCLYLIVVFFFGKEKVDYKELLKVYHTVAIAASVYIFAQAAFFYGAGIVLPHKIGGRSLEAASDIGRLRSFYSEPAELSYNLLPFIVCSLFGAPYKTGGKSKETYALIVTAAVIVSTSGQGILAAAVVWAYWFFIRFKNKALQTRQLILGIGMILVAIVLYWFGILEFALDRAGNVDEGGALDARLSGFVTLELLSFPQLLFGTGFGNYVVKNVYMLNVFYEFVNYSSIAEFLFTLGIVGTLLWAVFFFNVYREGNTCARVLLMVMLVLSVAGCPMTGKHFPLWLTVICVQLPEGQFSRASRRIH